MDWRAAVETDAAAFDGGADCLFVFQEFAFGGQLNRALSQPTRRGNASPVAIQPQYVVRRAETSKG